MGECPWAIMVILGGRDYNYPYSPQKPWRFLKIGTPKPWVSILKSSLIFDDLGYP